MTSKSFFVQISNLNIVLNLIIGLGAVFLLERLDPAIDQILRENALSVEAALGMQEELISYANNQSEDIDRKTYEESFWRSYEKAKKNITLSEENALVEKVKNLGGYFWGEEEDAKKVYLDLLSSVQILAETNLKAMSDRQVKARQISQTGAWSLGFLLFLTTLLQLLLRNKILNQLINPMRVLCKVIVDYSKGNILRRYHFLNCSTDIKEAGTALNKILDKKEEL